MPPIIAISQQIKTYETGLQALKGIDLAIHAGENFSLMGPTGAGKTTQIIINCGIVKPTSGTLLDDGHDIVHDFRAARAKIGLEPQ